MAKSHLTTLLTLMYIVSFFLILPALAQTQSQVVQGVRSKNRSPAVQFYRFGRGRGPCGGIGPNKGMADVVELQGIVTDVDMGLINSRNWFG